MWRKKRGHCELHGNHNGKECGLCQLGRKMDVLTKHQMSIRIEELSAQLAWRPIDMPPEQEGMYLCLLPNAHHVLFWHKDDGFNPFNVTHWMPLPESPEDLT